METGWLRRRKEKPTGHGLSGTAQQTAPISSRIVAWGGRRLAGSEASRKEGATVGRGMAPPNSGRLYPGREGEAVPRADGDVPAASHLALSSQPRTNMANTLIWENGPKSAKSKYSQKKNAPATKTRRNGKRCANYVCQKLTRQVL